MSDRKNALPVPSKASLQPSKPYRIDPRLKAMLPSLKGAERADLKIELRAARRCSDSVKAAQIDGEEGPPILWDGHNRDSIIDELRAEGVEIESPAVEVTDFPNLSSVVEAMFRRQDARRNWGPSDRAFAVLRNESVISALKAAALKRKQNGKKLGLHEVQGRTDEILKGMGGVGRDTIRKARAVLQRKDGEELAAKVEAGELSLREAHAEVREKTLVARAEQARKERPAYRYEPSDGWENQILLGDNKEKLPLLPSGSGTLFFFSPPYATEMVRYDVWKFEDYRKWLRDLYAVLKEAYRILRRGGRIWINVDATSDCMKNATTKYDVEFDVKRLAKRAGFTFLDEIVWFKQKTCGSDGHIAWGTYCSPLKPNVRRSHEYVIGFFKDTPFLEVDGVEGLSEAEVKSKRERLTDGLPDDFRHATVSVQNFDAKNRQAAELTENRGDGLPSFRYVPTARRNGSHPCPFPERLAELIISCFSYRGDVVIDPYVGSGTTAAVAKRLGRRWVGIDISEEYCKVAQERLLNQNDEARSAAEDEAKDQLPSDSTDPTEDADGEAGACAAA